MKHLFLISTLMFGAAMACDKYGQDIMDCTYEDIYGEIELVQPTASYERNSSSSYQHYLEPRRPMSEYELLQESRCRWEWNDDGSYGETFSC